MMKQTEEGNIREKILNILKANEKYWFSIRELVKITGNTRSYTKENIEKLVRKGLVKKKLVGNNKTYYKWDGYL